MNERRIGMKPRGWMMMFAGMVCLIFGIVTCVQAEVQWKIGGMYPENSNYGQAFNKLSELAKEYSNGELNIKVYHGAVLGKKMQSLENIQRGTTDIHIETLDVFEGYVPECYYQSMPYLFKNVDHMRKFLQSDWFEKYIHSKFKSRGMFIPSQDFAWERGPYRVLVCKVPILKVEELEKIKVRCYASETYRRAWDALGAKTTNVDWTEVYLALKQNMIQGVMGPINLIKPMKFTEAAKYLIRINEFPQLLVVVVNQKSYDKLTPFQKEALRKAYDGAGEYYTNLNYASAEADIDYMLEEHGATFIRPSLPAWREKIKPFYKELEKEGKVTENFYENVQALMQ
jgi:TRAP-type C4-dicarboxylate transport system substrate-binding protein